MSLEESIEAAVERATEKVLAKLSAQNSHPVLARRETVARMLDCDLRQVDRLREQGVLVPVFFPARDGQKRQTPYYRVADILTLAEKYKAD